MKTLSRLDALARTAEYREATRDLPILDELTRRFREERPFADTVVASGHVLVFNSLAAIRALAAGGAEVLICDPFPGANTRRVARSMARHDLPVSTIEHATRASDLFLDVTAVLGRHRLPRAAAELSRSGDHFYADQPCITVTSDGTQTKKIETFFGLGDGMVRAWKMLKPGTALAGLRAVQFGYGKVGRGVAHRLRREHMGVVIAEIPGRGAELASAEGFEVVTVPERARLQESIETSELVVAASGVPDAVADAVPVEWLGGKILVSLGAVDEFGEAIAADRVLGGKGKPLNFHLDSPTANRYVGSSLAAHLLALEQVVRHGSQLRPGLHALDPAADRWLLSRWQQHWPDEDLSAALAA